jgi:hypothetical protein
MLNRRTLCAALPLVMAGTAPSQAATTAVLTVTGRTRDGKPMAFEMAALAALTQQRITTQTPWYPQAREFSGPLLADVLRAAGAQGRLLRATALNDYSVEIPFTDAAEHGVVLARLLDGQPMAVRDKGPLFIIYPFDSKPALRTPVYYARCIWQLRSIDVAA